MRPCLLLKLWCDCRSFDEASPRVKRSRVANSTSLPAAPENGPVDAVGTAKTGSTSRLSVSEDRNFSTGNKVMCT